MPKTSKGTSFVFPLYWNITYWIISNICFVEELLGIKHCAKNHICIIYEFGSIIVYILQMRKRRHNLDKLKAHIQEVAEAQREPVHLSLLPSQILCCLYLRSAVTGMRRFRWVTWIYILEAVIIVAIFFLLFAFTSFDILWGCWKSWWRKIPPFHRWILFC